MNDEELHDNEQLRSEEEKLRTLRQNGGSSIDILDLQYRIWIKQILRRPDVVISPRVRQRLKLWYDEGLKDRLPPLPADLHWMEVNRHATSWIQLVRSLRMVAAIRHEALPEGERSHALHKLFREIRKQLEAFPGRPIKPGMTRIGKQAAMLFDKGLTGGEVALKLCEQRGTNHHCNKNCADRLRRAAERFKQGRCQ